MPPLSSAPRCLACSGDEPKAMTYTGFLRLCCKATIPDASSLPYLLQRQTHPCTCAPPRSACSTLLILIVSYPIMHCLQGMGVQEEGFLANSLYYSALINCVCSANLTSLLFLFRPQPVREEEGKFCQRDWYCYSWCGTPVYLCRSHILQLASLCLCFVSSSQLMALACWLGKTICSSALSF